MNPSVKVFFGLIGGLAMFLYGMNCMSEALQKTAGERMKKILGFLTKNAVMGAVAGALVTAVLQSSSATTVMVIGFVSAGLMTLPQGISVIFGANIGTTMTAQLMAIKLSNYIYPIIFIGFLVNFIAKKEKSKNIGLAIFSFGLLFEGIEIMGHVMKPLATSPIFLNAIEQVAQTPILGIALGTLMTLVVQSSSATIAVLQNFASQAGPDGVHSVIGLTGAIPILLGDNIGTTITALLASIGQSVNAKRTALAHSFFNISGSIVFACLIPLFAQVVTTISPQGREIDVISRQIANAHTMFNVICTCIWLPLLPLMVKIVTTIVRGSEKKVVAEEQPQFLDDNVLEQPAAAIMLVRRETRRSADFVKQIIEVMTAELLDNKSAEADFTKSYQHFKSLNTAVCKYINDLFSRGSMTGEQSQETSLLLYINYNLGRIEDRCSEIIEVKNKLLSRKDSLSPDAMKELSYCCEAIASLFEQTMNTVEAEDLDLANEIVMIRDNVHASQLDFKRAHLERIKNKVCDPVSHADYSGLLYNLDRIVDNCANIAEDLLVSKKSVLAQKAK